MRFGKLSGFTLIELMVVVIVIAILVGIGYPSYQDYVRKGKRAECRGALLRAAQTQERFFTDQNRYANQAEIATASGVAGTIYSGDNPNLASGAYTITVALGAGNTSFTLTATPNAAAPFADPTCGNLTLTSAAVRSWATTPANPERCRW